jgi:hypothetical protein
MFFASRSFGGRSFRAMTLQELLEALGRTEAGQEPGDDVDDAK